MSRQNLPRNFEVVARVRPVLGEHEIAVSASDDQHVCVAVRPRNRKALVPKQGGRSHGYTGTQSYEFNSVLGGSATQADVCRAINIDSKVQAALDGFPVLVFAFGQTSAGKTHTVVGCLADQGEDELVREGTSIAVNDAAESNNDGVMFTALRQGFFKAQQQTQREFQMCVSAVEIYNEQVVDLLNNRQELLIRHRRDHGFYLQGLRRTVCSDITQATSVLKRALAYRRSRAHQMNETSSRSHAIITFHFDSWAAPGSAEAGEAAKAEKLFSLLKRARKAHASAISDASTTSSSNGSVAESAPVVGLSSLGQRFRRRMRKYGQLVFVDLAGSERLKATGSHHGEGMSESCAINRSLFALGRVLHALSEKSKGRQQPVPVRDSALTKILAHGLESAAHTTMIACLNPKASQLGQSTSTLHFARVALSIKTSPVARLDPRDRIVMDLKQKISSLRKENQSLTKAFLWLCSGTADWDTLIQQLPEHVSQQLPASAPPLVSPAPSQSCLHGDLVRPSSGSRSSMAARPGTPAVMRPRTSTASPIQAPASAAAPPTSSPQIYPGNRTSLAVVKSGSTNAQPPGMPSATVRNNLLQFPALAALESEFQELVSRPASAAQEELLQVDALNMASQDVGRRLPPVPVESTFTTLSANVMAGNNVTPGYVHEALDRSSTCDTVNHVVRVSAGDDECSADCCTTPSHNDALDGAYGMEPNALLWALKNFWFGVEEDMTEFAYKVHDKLRSDGITPVSKEYYDQLSASVKLAFPDKWKTYSGRGCMLNTMSKQQGIINSAMTVEHALSNRAAWASSRVAAKVYGMVPDKRALRNSWPRLCTGRTALVEELAASRPATLIETGTGTACVGHAVGHLSDVRSRSTSAAPPVAISPGEKLQATAMADVPDKLQGYKQRMASSHAGFDGYMKHVRGRSVSPCKPCALPARSTNRPFSAGRCQTPGELMRQHMVSKLELASMAETSQKGRPPMLAAAPGSLPSWSAGSQQGSKPQCASQYSTGISSGSVCQDRSLFRPDSFPQQKPWNDCPNVDLPRWQGRS